MILTMTMLCKRTTLAALSLALAAVVATDAASPIDRRLELADICRYSPDTKVTDENALDKVRCPVFRVVVWYVDNPNAFVDALLFTIYHNRIKKRFATV
jgi:hypothetical protein